jgi:high affinity sulfate transporter 1
LTAVSGAPRAGGGFTLAGWLRGYPRAALQPDITAGLTTAAVVIPKAMAFASIAGLPPQVGLYTAFGPMAIYAVLGTSPTLSVSTTTTIAILTAAQLGGLGPDAGTAALVTAGATLALLVGAFLLLAALLRLGAAANFISDPVLTGFKAGLGLVIVVDQLPKLLGLHLPKGGFLQNLGAIAHALPATSMPTFALGATLLLLILLLEHLAPRIPAVLLAVVVGIAVSATFLSPASGVDLVGAIPQGLPRFVPPDVALLASLWPAALGIALMSFTETIAAGRAFARHGDPRPAANRELVALGLANVGGALFGAMSAGGGTSQTAVNRRAGARTQLAGLVAAAVSAATLLVLAPLVGRLPQTVLAAVVIATSYGLVSLVDFRAIRRVRATEFAWAVIACVGVVTLGTLRGILVAVAASLIALLRQSQDPPVYALGRKPGTAVFRARSDAHPADETLPGLLLVRLEGRAYFGNAQRIADKLWELVGDARPSVLVIDCSAVFDLEYSVLRALEELDERLREAGVELWIAALNPGSRLVFERAPIGRLIGRERRCEDLADAVERFQRARVASAPPPPPAGPTTGRP